jgi:hypothetical protein
MQMQLLMFDRCMDTFKSAERRAFGVEPNLECDRVHICRRRRPEWDEILAQSGGYHLPKASTIIEVPPLPDIIHSVKGDLSHFPYLGTLEEMIWAVPYSRALGGGLENTERLTQWLDHQKLSSENLILLHQETHDEELERVFEKTFHPNFFPILRSAPNCVSISPGYSVYDDGSMCRHHQLYNMWRSIDFFVRACASGVPCIPSLGWNLKEDLDRIAEWLNAHPALQYVAMNAQTLSVSQFAMVSAAMKYIENKARKLRWVVFGGQRISEFLNANGFGGRLHLVTTTHIQKANAGRSLDVSYQPYSKVERFLGNYRIMAKTFGHYTAPPRV